ADGAILLSRYLPLTQEQSFFDRFAGIFLAFGNLERNARAALRDNRAREVTYRLFGQKYDSLGSLLSRVRTESLDNKGDLIDHYVITSCARQLVQELRRENEEFWRENASDVRSLDEQLASLAFLRERLVARDAEQMGPFLDWFDRW